MQHRRRQHLDADDRAGENAGDAGYKRFQPAKAEAPKHDEAKQEENRCTDQGGNDGLAEHVAQLGRRQIQAYQEQQEDDPDMADVADELGIGYPGETVRAEQHADAHIGNQ